MKKINIFLLLLILIFITSCAKDKNSDITNNTDNIIEVETDEIFKIFDGYTYGTNGENSYYDKIMIIDESDDYVYDLYTDPDKNIDKYNSGYVAMATFDAKEIIGVKTKWFGYRFLSDISFANWDNLLPYSWMMAVQRKGNNITGVVGYVFVGHECVEEVYYIIESIQLRFPKVNDEYQNIPFEYVYNKVQDSIEPTLIRLVKENHPMTQVIYDMYPEYIVDGE